ncbi:MAG: ThuA domain-containing protein [Chitinophagaceae bacterium]
MRNLQTPNSTIAMLKNRFAFTIVFILISNIILAQHASKKISMLVYTKNGKGYVHDNIASAVEALKQLAQEEKFSITVSDNPEVFSENNLKQYTLLVFPSTNNDIFDNDDQRLAFRRYIEAGGALVGLHSVTGTERNWKWFKMLIGCTFSWHAKYQKFSFQVLDKNHPSMKNVPATWEREDECYFGKELYPVTNILMTHRFVTLDSSQKELVQKNAGTYAEYYPAVWHNEFQGGRAWISTVGHSKETYQDPVYKNHLLQGIKFVISQSKGIDFKKSFSTHRDDQLKN